MKEMIRRFDETLAVKANKMSLTELEQKIGKTFLKLKYWDEMLQKF